MGHLNQPRIDEVLGLHFFRPLGNLRHTTGHWILQCYGERVGDLLQVITPIVEAMVK